MLMYRIIAIIIVSISTTKDFTPCHIYHGFNFPRKARSILHQPLLTKWNDVCNCIVSHEFSTFHAKRGPSYTNPCLRGETRSH